MQQKVSRRTFLSTSLVAAAAAARPQWSLAQGASARKPNVLIILADDLGAGDLSCCGGKEIGRAHV
mgnify:CR=1 FL=1